MQWVIKHLLVKLPAPPSAHIPDTLSSAWLFFKLMNVSGAEAVVAAASPWVGQGESACLVRPYVDYMTESELHVTMTSGEFDSSRSGFLAGLILQRFFDDRWLRSRCIHPAWCPRTESRHIVCDEYSGLDRYQQDALARARRAPHERERRRGQRRR